MEQIKIPDGYQSSLNLHDTQIAIKTVKDFFQQTLAQKLNLLRVSAPVFVNPSSGLNDNLNGVERPVSFDIKGQPENAEIVHSLAKWKRYALQKYGFAHGEGLYTDMIAIRRDEDLDNIHSVYVDQWDWEKIISKEERNMDTLVSTVRAIYSVLRKTEKYMAVQFESSSVHQTDHYDISCDLLRIQLICKLHSCLNSYIFCIMYPTGDQNSLPLFFSTDQCYRNSEFCPDDVHKS